MEKEYKDKNYVSFLALIDSYPSIKDMFNSPQPDEVDEIYKNICAHLFYTESITIRNFEKAVDELENLYSESKKKIGEEFIAATEPFRILCRNERKVRLLVRILYLLGESKEKEVVDIDIQRVQRIDSLKKNILSLRVYLNCLIQDEIFLESIRSKENHNFLKNLDNLIEVGVSKYDWLDKCAESRDKFVFKRAIKSNSDESTEITRYLCDRFSDAAYRLYGECSISILRNLFKAVSLPGIRDEKIKKIFENALEVKQETYLKQEDRESMSTWGQDEIWGYGRGYWSPQRSLAAPWFRG